MNIQQLRYFVEVAEHLNFTEASKHLYIGQPSLSRQIAELEREIGVCLFIRNKRSVTLTPAGSVLLKKAQTIIALSVEAIDLTRKAGRGLIGSLSIGYFMEISTLPRLMSELHGKYPDTVIMVHRYSWGELSEALIHGDVDIAFTYSFGLENMPEIAYRTLFPDVLVVALPENHLLSGKSKIELSSLSKENFININRSVSPLAYEKTQQVCRRNGFTPNIVYETPHMESLLLLVEAGMGVSITTRNLSAHTSPALRYIDIEGENVDMDIAVAWNEKNKNPAIQLILGELGILKANAMT
jgi:DNA-binding transcriptional LysR family regulator